MEHLFLRTRNAKIKDVVILFHGWAGGIENVKELAFEIYDKFNVSVYVPVLTGHESDDPADFANATHKDWLSDIDAAVDYVKSEGYRITAFGGYSMGGLLATIAAEKYKISELVLIAPAFYVINQHIRWMPLLSKFIKAIPRLKTKEFPLYAKYYDTEYMKTQREVYNKYHWIKPAAALYRLQKIARKSYLRNRNLDITMFFSEADIVVGAKARVFAMSNITSHNSIHPLVLPEGNHQICNDTRFNTQVIKFITDHMFRAR